MRSLYYRCGDEIIIISLYSSILMMVALIMMRSLYTFLCDVIFSECVDDDNGDDEDDD